MEKWSNELEASGFAARWSQEGERVLYTAESKSLACLENLVHRSAIALSQSYMLLVIYIPEEATTELVNINELPKQWTSQIHYKTCQKISHPWYKKQEHLLLQVPSSIISTEFNYVINTQHRLFKDVKIIERIPFAFDGRLKDAI